ncbi:MAG: glycosyltransferase family 4 protein [Magnetococcales bacterium]|nr:glycosyltransferase family 4 protein [Magnetococcales bacterium]
MAERLFINGRFLVQPLSGVQRFSRECVRALDHLLTERSDLGARWQVELLLPASAPEVAGEDGLLTSRLQTIRHRCSGGLNPYLWEQLTLPRLVGNNKLFSPGNAGPIAVRRQMVVMHDASVFSHPGGYGFAYRTLLKAMQQRLAHRVEATVTVSDYSARELSRFLSIPKESIPVLGEGGEHLLRPDAEPEIIARHALHERPFLLGVSSFNPNKNMTGLIRALDHLKDLTFDVVWVGAGDASIYGRVALPKGVGVRWIGRADDGQLRALYERAHGLVFPSLQEGFGLPPVEAMVLGCPVLAARAGSLPEVCGDAVLYCDPHDPVDIAHGMRRLLTEPDLRQSLQKRGRAHGATHSWSGTAERVLAVMDAMGSESR